LTGIFEKKAMINLTEYSSIEDAINYIIKLLPEPTVSRVAAVVKYARVDQSNIKIKAVKVANPLGTSWNLEVTVGILT
jgi:hypothetical protein